MMNKRSIFALFLLFSLAMMSLSRESNSYRVHEYHSGKVARICDSLFLVSVCKKLTKQRRQENIILSFSCSKYFHLLKVQFYNFLLILALSIHLAK